MPTKRNVTLVLPADLVEWLDREAKANRRSRAQHLAWLLEQMKIKKEREEGKRNEQL